MGDCVSAEEFDEAVTIPESRMMRHALFGEIGRASMPATRAKHGQRVQTGKLAPVGSGDGRSAHDTKAIAKSRGAYVPDAGNGDKEYRHWLEDISRSRRRRIRLIEGGFCGGN